MEEQKTSAEFDERVKKFQQLLKYFSNNASKMAVLLQNYEKNIQAMNKSFLLKRDPPSLAEINSNFYLNFCRPSGLSIKSFSNKAKSVLIWIVSAYETLICQSHELFTHNHWKDIVSFIPNLDEFTVKYKWFTFKSEKESGKNWSPYQDNFLLKTMKKFYPLLFVKAGGSYSKISWLQISFDISKNFVDLLDFRTDKQCKERWFNHLNPFIKKKCWSLEEDISLLSESMNNPKKWAMISKNFPGRTQHDIKNRFICLIKKKNELSRRELRLFLNSEQLMGMIFFTLQDLLSQKENKQQKKEQIQPNDYEKEREDESFFQISSKLNNGFPKFQDEDDEVNEKNSFHMTEMSYE